MANRNWASGGKCYSMHVMPILLDAHGTVNATGGIDNLVGPCISSITKLDTGIYKIKLQDNYSGLYHFDCDFDGQDNAGSAADPSGVATNKVYIISTVGDTDWESAGLNPGITPAVGVAFFLTANPIAGTGRVDTYAASGIDSCELIGNPNTTLAPQQVQNQGGELIFQTLFDATPTDPFATSVMRIKIYLSNSSILIGGE